jgi:DNA polymerase-3 subunit alpha
MGWPPSKADRLAKAIPATPGITLAQAEKESPEFKKLLSEDPECRVLFELAQSVEGIARHTGVHAAGVVISKDPIHEHIPLYRGTDGQPITAYEMGILEKLNMLKMDFLGLSNLTVIARTVEAVNKSLDEGFDIRKIPLDDEKTFQMLSSGETTGVFQLESAGMRRYVAELKPTSIRELAAMIALYRPGPLNHIPTYISNKFGKTKPQILDDRMKPILEETYGVIVYQDQVLKLVQALAGFSLGKADLLRRAMGKKDKDAMKALAKDFFAGTDANGMPRDKAEKVWELLLPFAGYAFNKAHAICYAFLAYRTAYLKAHFPAEYMAALLDAYKSREDKVVAFVEQARRMGIKVLPPDVNSSEAGFAVKDGSIQFGLTAIKGVGNGLVQAILQSRDGDSGKFTHLFEFASRLKSNGLSKNSLEALIKSGALDSIEPNRARTLEAHEAALIYAERITKSREVGQDSLFLEESNAVAEYPALPEIPDLPRMQKLASEKEVLGVYVSDHPLRGYESFLRRSISHQCANIEEVPDGTQVQLAGILVNVRTQIRKTTKEMWAQIAIEDLTGVATLLAFPKTYEKYKQHLIKDSIVKLKGVVVHSQFQGESRIEVRLEHIEPLELKEDEPKHPELDTPKLALKIRRAGRDDLRRLENLAAKHVGIHRLVIKIETDTGVQEVPTRYLVEPSTDFRDNLLGVFPDAAVEIEAPKVAC